MLLDVLRVDQRIQEHVEQGRKGMNKWRAKPTSAAQAKEGARFLGIFTPTDALVK